MEQVYPVIVALIFNALDLVTGLVSAVKRQRHTEFKTKRRSF